MTHQMHAKKHPKHVHANIEEQLIQASTLAKQGQLAKAQTICTNILTINAREHRAFFLLGSILNKKGDHDDAISYYKQAVTLQPQEAHYHLKLGRILCKTNHTDQGIFHLEKAIDINNNIPQAYQFLGSAYGNKLALEKAINAYQQCLTLNPNQPTVIAQLAALYEMSNNIDAMEKLLKKAEEQFPDHVDLLLPLAKLKQRHHDFVAARRYLDKLLTIANTDGQRTTIFNQVAKLLDKQGKYKEAMTYFMQCQSLLEKVNNDRYGHVPNYFMDRVHNVSRWTNNDASIAWKEQQSPTDRQPVFLIGFPRSGTTLLEQILAAHPKCEATQEAGIIDKMITNLSHILDRDICFPDDLTTFQQQDITKLQHYYWQHIDQLFSHDVSNKIVIDKMPLDIVNLPLIIRIFPHAKIIMAVRDPRDVVLSCFMQTFKHNSAMAQFYSIKQTVDSYNDIMNLYYKYKKLFIFNLHEIMYESLLENLPYHAATLIEFIDLEWDDAVLDYYQSNNNRHVITPSYEGVMKPVYTTSVNRWKNYADFIAPYEKKLIPHLDHFHYEQ